MSHRPVFLHTAWQVLGAQFFRTIALRQFVLKNPCQQPRQRSYRPVFAHRLTSLGHTVFRHIRRDVICPENPCAQLCAFSLYCFLQTELSPSYFPQCPFRPQTISHGFPSVHPFIASVSLLPLGALPKLFPTVSLPSTLSSFPYRSFPPELSPSYFPRFRKLFARFPLRPACCLAPSQRSSPQAISTVSCPSSMLSRSLPAKLSASYLHGFQSVQHCLAPSEAFRKLFARFPLRPASLPPQAICTVSCPVSMLSRSLPAKLSASYFRFPPVQHAVSLPPGEALRKLFPRFPLRPACCLAPSQRSSPQAICTVSSPSSMLSRSVPAKLSVSYFHGFLSVHMLSRFLPAKLSASYFHGFLPSSMLSRSLPAKLSASFFHGFLSVQHAVSLPPSEALRKLFARFPLRPACCLAPSLRSSPQAICTVSSPFSMSRFLPAKLSPSYLHGFQSVQHAVSLPPSEAFRKLFARFPLRPACCLAPSQRSSPQAISTVSSPSSMLSRSLPAKLSASYLHGFLSVQHAVSLPPSEALSPSYFHGFLSVQHAVSLPPSEAFRKLFARFPVRPACCLAPSRRSSPQAISTVSSRSSMLSRSLPAKLFVSYFHGFLSVQHAVSLPRSEAFRKLFPRFPVRPACCLAPSQRSSP